VRFTPLRPPAGAALDGGARRAAAYFCFGLTACQRPLTSPCIG
jgi:hypothetical protein